jgi:hypothetical protein
VTVRVVVVVPGFITQAVRWMRSTRFTRLALVWPPFM